MKESKYNVFVKLNGNDGYLVYNLLTSSVILVKNKEELFNNIEKFEKYGFFVSEDFNEMKCLISKRSSYLCSEKDYKRYTILPTTKCNARCAYCYENDNLRFNMSDDVCKQLIDFIKRDCISYRKMRIYWFGGEPLVRRDLIDNISAELIDFCLSNDISYRASMATNLSLINEADVAYLKEDLFVDKIEFAFDGTEDLHNHSKNYTFRDFNAFRHNIEMLDVLLETGITVQVRFNIDKQNYYEMLNLIEDIMKKYPNNSNLLMYLGIIFKTPFNDQIQDSQTILMTELADYLIPFYRLQWKYGFINSILDLPLHLKTNNCYATNINSLVIGPKGIITKCQMAPDDVNNSIGNVFSGMVYNDVFFEWCKTDCFDECIDCKFFPVCLTGCVGQKFVYSETPCCKEKFYFDELLNFGYEIMSDDDKETLNQGRVLSLKRR